MAPPDVAYVASWVSFDLARCYQVMEAPDRASVETWTEKWRDIVDFEIIPVVTSEAAANGGGRAVEPRPREHASGVRRDGQSAVRWPPADERVSRPGNL